MDFNNIPVSIVIISTIVIILSLGFAGCENTDPTQGYTSGQLYRDNIKTVHVKMFESNSFRRGVEFELTRPLVQLIELKTPYKVVADSSRADTIITGIITNISEQVMTQQRDLDRPIENQVVITAKVTWKDQRNGKLIMENKVFRISGEYAYLLGAGRETAAKDAANEMAQRIVEAMELPW